MMDEDRRLAILRIQYDTDGSVNDSIAQDALDQLGHRVGRQTIRDDFAWLAGHGLVTVDKLSDTLAVATITQRGQDAATGRVRVDGVKRPGPII